jgi:hypothetical protein
MVGRSPADQPRAFGVAGFCLPHRLDLDLHDVVFETHETADLTGGRVETRRHTACHKVDWMTSDRHYPGEPMFPDLA